MAGKLVWTGTTNMTWCNPASCTFATTPVPVRFELTATSLAGAPVALLDPASVGVDPAAGGLVEVTSALRNFKVNILMLAQRPGVGPALDAAGRPSHPRCGAPRRSVPSTGRVGQASCGSPAGSPVAAWATPGVPLQTGSWAQWRPRCGPCWSSRGSWSHPGGRSRRAAWSMRRAPCACAQAPWRSISSTPGLWRPG